MPQGSFPTGCWCFILRGIFLWGKRFSQLSLLFSHSLFPQFLQAQRVSFNTHFHFPFKHHTLCTDHKVESIKGSLMTFLKNYTSQGPGDLILRIACFFPTCLFFISPPWDDTPRIANKTYMTLLGQAFSGLHRPWQLDRSVTMANISQLLCSTLTDTKPCKYLQHQEFDKINNYTSPVPCALKPV